MLRGRRVRSPRLGRVRRVRDLVGAVATHPSAVLLGAQLLTLLATPFAERSRLGSALLGVLEVVVVAIAIWVVRRTPVVDAVALGLGVPAAVFAVLEALLPHHDAIILVSGCLHAPFYFYVSYAMIRYLFDDNTVTRDELFATAAAFTVVAWGFAYVYAVVQVLWPGSFTTSGADVSWFALLFLSFTTLTNTGLSDLSPTLSHARSVVAVEEVAGVFYIGLVIARLVGLTMARVGRDS